jgi:hypothetical protein
VSFAIGTLARIAVVAYLGLTTFSPLRNWTIYAGNKSWSLHGFIYAESKTGERYRYDVHAYEYDKLESWKHPFTTYEGNIRVSRLPPSGPMILVAKLSERGKMLWDRMVVGSWEVYPGYKADFSYNFYVFNCYTWTGAAAVQAVIISLLPI